jgi:hypothetical protein
VTRWKVEYFSKQSVESLRKNTIIRCCSIELPEDERSVATEAAGSTAVGFIIAFVSPSATHALKKTYLSSLKTLLLDVSQHQ